MVREWREMSNDVGLFGDACRMLWVVMVTLSIMSAIIWSCADGVSKEKSSAADSDPHGGGCAAACGAACGA